MNKNKVQICKLKLQLPQCDKGEIVKCIQARETTQYNIFLAKNRA